MYNLSQITFVVFKTNVTLKRKSFLTDTKSVLCLDFSFLWASAAVSVLWKLSTKTATNKLYKESEKRDEK